MPKKRWHINLMDVTSTEELQRMKQFPQLIELLVKPVKDITFEELTALGDAQIYCSLSVSVHDELLERVDHHKFGVTV